MSSFRESNIPKPQPSLPGVLFQVCFGMPAYLSDVFLTDSKSSETKQRFPLLREVKLDMSPLLKSSFIFSLCVGVLVTFCWEETP